MWGKCEPITTPFIFIVEMDHKTVYYIFQEAEG